MQCTADGEEHFSPATVVEDIELELSDDSPMLGSSTGDVIADVVAEVVGVDVAEDDSRIDDVDSMDVDFMDVDSLDVVSTDVESMDVESLDVDSMDVVDEYTYDVESTLFVSADTNAATAKNVHESDVACNCTLTR